MSLFNNTNMPVLKISLEKLITVFRLHNPDCKITSYHIKKVVISLIYNNSWYAHNDFKITIKPFINVDDFLSLAKCLQEDNYVKVYEEGDSVIIIFDNDKFISLNRDATGLVRREEKCVDLYPYQTDGDLLEYKFGITNQKLVGRLSEKCKYNERAIKKLMKQKKKHPVENYIYYTIIPTINKKDINRAKEMISKHFHLGLDPETKEDKSMAILIEILKLLMITSLQDNNKLDIPKYKGLSYRLRVLLIADWFRIQDLHKHVRGFKKPKITKPRIWATITFICMVSSMLMYSIGFPENVGVSLGCLILSFLPFAYTVKLFDEEN